MSATSPTRTSSPTNTLETLFANASDSRDYAAGVLRRMVEIYQSLEATKVAEFIRILDRAIDEGNAIFIIGNGGSSAAASHMVNDLCVNNFVEGAPTVRAFSLTDNVPSLTAVANDLGYENIFLRQLQQLMRPRDVVLALSVSGNSRNIVKAIEYANANGAVTVGISGFDGGWLAEHAGFAIHVPSTPDEYGPVEDVFATLGHIASGYLTLKRGLRLSH